MEKCAVIIHEEAEGGFWAEVPALPGCYSQGESSDELMANVREAIAGVLEVMKERVRARRFEEGERKVVSIPVHGNRDLKRGLANRIARDRY